MGCCADKRGARERGRSALVNDNIRRVTGDSWCLKLAKAARGCKPEHQTQRSSYPSFAFDMERSRKQEAQSIYYDTHGDLALKGLNNVQLIRASGGRS